MAKKRNLIMIPALLCMLAPVSVKAEDEIVIDLDSGAERSSSFVSVNAPFSNDAGTFQLVMYGLKDVNKDVFLQALADHYDPSSGAPVKIKDNAFADAEKFESEPEDWRSPDADASLCWAASASNMLWMSGWTEGLTNPDSGTPFASEDEVFAYYCNHFYNGGSDVKAGIDWFFMGEFYVSAASGGRAVPKDSRNPENGLIKDFFSTDMQKYYDLTGSGWQDIEMLSDCDGNSASPAVFQASIGELSDGRAVTSTHSVTCAGFIIDPAETDPALRYKAIAIIDSDNDGIPSEGLIDPTPEERYADKVSRPNSVTFYNLELITDADGKTCWHLVGREGYEPQIIYALNRLPLYDPGLIDSYRETEGNCSVYNTPDLEAVLMFTTDRTEPVTDLYRKDPEDYTKRVFEPGETINLNYFAVNRSVVIADEEYAAGRELHTDWHVIRNNDQTVTASGTAVAELPLYSSGERGYMICLNAEEWPAGEYTVYLDLNKDRNLPEAYYLNNRQLSFDFTITGTDPEPVDPVIPDETPIQPRKVPNTAALILG